MHFNAIRQIEIVFGWGQSDGRQRLVKKHQCFWDVIWFAAQQRLSHSYTNIHKDLLHTW